MSSGHLHAVLFNLNVSPRPPGQNAWSEADCVTLLDSTSVTVQPNGSGSFAVYKSFKVQTPKGAVNNHVIKYDYDPLTAFARFKQVTVQRANGETMQVDVTKTCDYAAPARAIYWGARQIMLELGRWSREMSFPTKSVRKALLMLCWQELKMMTRVHSAHARAVLRHCSFLGE